jgi:hypothetical protein
MKPESSGCKTIGRLGMVDWKGTERRPFDFSEATVLAIVFRELEKQGD